MNKINVAPSQRNAPSDSLYYDPDFSEKLINWQKQHGRHALPWQQTGDAYKVWLSEIMLQQTQVTAVIPYYQRFLASFPTVHALAAAPVEEVMALWAGLGYYTRARNLHQCAKQVVEKYQGIFPSDPKLLQELPGIGRSTAAAIAAFSYGTIAAILDGNVKRVFARVFGVEGYPGTKSVEDALWLRAQALLPSSDIGAYTQGLMDLGATLCRRGKPECSRCPFQSRCVAYAQGRTAELPVRKPKTRQKEKQTVLLLLEYDGQVLVEQRPMTGIWGGLISLPEVDGMRDTAQIEEQPLSMELAADVRLHPQFAAAQTVVHAYGEYQSVAMMNPFVHVFTHFKLQVQVFHFKMTSLIPFASEGKMRWASLRQVDQLALPAPIKTLLQNLSSQ